MILSPHLWLSFPFNDINYWKGGSRSSSNWWLWNEMPFTSCHNLSQGHHNSGTILYPYFVHFLLFKWLVPFPFGWNFNKRTMAEFWDWLLLPGNCHSKFMQPTQAVTGTASFGRLSTRDSHMQMASAHGNFFNTAGKYRVIYIYIQLFLRLNSRKILKLVGLRRQCFLRRVFVNVI